jgi:hypothetical protein
MRLSRICVSLLTVAGVVAGARAAWAEPFVYRPLTLSRSEWALDFGLGIAHEPGPSVTGAGVNLELAAGLTSEIQLGFRTGIRIGADGRRTQADSYGRTFETETYDTGGETLANPELSLRWALARSTAEVALDTRVYLPFADGSRVGVMIGLPIAIHIGSVARLDTGIYVPIIFTHPVSSVISIPLHLWFQASNHLFLGPLTGIRIYNPGGHDTVAFGFGLGSALSHDVDLKAWLLFPDINDDNGTHSFGFGVGLQFRF